jgi:hypothetical protein
MVQCQCALSSDTRENVKSLQLKQRELESPTTLDPDFEGFKALMSRWSISSREILLPHTKNISLL